MIGSYGMMINLFPYILLLLALTYPCFSSSYPKSNKHLCPPSQRDALLHFMRSYDNESTKWNEHIDCCHWDGISCDNMTGDVICIDVSFWGLTGTIENISYLFPLHNLQELDLSLNNFHGVVPPELSHLSKLVSVSLLSFSDDHDHQLTMESHSLKLLVQNLTQLEILDLRTVKIAGDSSNALVNVSNALTCLMLSDCDLKGIFPEFIFHLPNILELEVAENVGLTVTLPTLNGSSPLERLILSSTNFSGKLPDTIGNFKNLRHLDISSCHILNSVPSSIGNLTGLTTLSLSSFAPKEAIPTSFCRLSSLFELFLPRNKFSGTIPQCLGNLTNLEKLDLSYNQLIGPFPQLLSNCTILRILNVSNNMINDRAAHSLESFQNLDYIGLGANSFHGEIPLAICRSKPIFVDLSNNRLTGTIPPCVINYTADLERNIFLNLQMNELEGTIPDVFPQGCHLAEINFSENRLKGPLPQSMVNCKDLIVLELGNNGIEDFFPNWLETLPILIILVLKSNKLHGEVKPLGNHHPFPHLQIFDISNNNLTGPLPIGYIQQFDAMKDKNVSDGPSPYLWLHCSVLFDCPFSTTITMKGLIYTVPKVLSALKLIDLSNNNFHGKIPEIIGELIALKGLNLSHNNFIGNIPPSIQSITNLECLDLSSNKLTGQIPRGLAQLTQLEILNLSHNELRGMIPKGKQFDTFGKDSFAGNLGLCGSQIEIACGEPNTPQPSTSPSFQEDDFDVFDWKIILMGYGCGLVIGFSIGYIILELQKPEWFMSLVEEKLLKKIVKPRRRINRP